MRLVRGDNGLQTEIEPGDTLSPAERACVVRALATVDVDDQATRANPSLRPSGFTALLRIEW